MAIFNKGDKVKRITVAPNNKIEYEGIYTVRQADTTYVWLEDIQGSWKAVHFRLVTKKDTKVIDSNSEWSYEVQSIYAIDWETMLSDLTMQKPLQLIELTNEQGIKVQFVGVHHTLLNKAQHLKLTFPGKPIKHHHNLFGCSKHFDEWVTWAKKVKVAPWKDKHSSKTNVSIKLITVQ